jgi:hypothetical protein
MTFLNQAILLVLAGVAIPILIHLLHRREARMRDWGAMRFLLASVAARQRRILLEEMLLMALRCALIALVVMAAARPFVPADSRVPWTIVLPAFLVGAMCAGIGAVLWAYRRVLATLMLALAFLLIAGAGGGSAYEYISHGGHWSGGRDARDVAIVIDGSMSMQVQVEGVSNFDRAVASAREAVNACRPADAICVILAGPMPQAATAGPISDRDAVYAALASLKPTSGAMGLLEALNYAASALDQGHNPDKEIVLITDGQNVGWDLSNMARWQFTASALSRGRGKTALFCRLLKLPQQFDDRSVADITFSRRVVGTDRPVAIEVKAANSGTASSGRGDVQVAVDGKALAPQRVDHLSAGAAQTVSVNYQFTTPGRHIVTAHLIGADDLAADDRATRVIDVLQDLPVLILEGAPSARPLEGAGAFMQVALAPGTSGPGARNLILPKVVSAQQVSTVADFSAYRVVVLADVPRLPAAAARGLRQFVRDGGGLLIAPGEHVMPEFYNDWSAGGSESLTPALLVAHKDDPAQTASPAIQSFSHPALALVADPAHSDAASAVIRSWWQLEVREHDRAVRVGATIEGGAPLLVERKLGKGYVLMTAISLGRRDSNWPTLKSYVPMLHEIVQYLAAPLQTDANVQPGAQVAADIPFPPGGQPAVRQAQLNVLVPSGDQRPATLTTGRTSWTASFAGTVAPGLYDFVVPAEMTGGQPSSVPFVVVRDPQESFLKPLQKEDLAEAQRRLPLTFAESDEDLVSLIVGTVPGREIWKQLAAFALLVLLAEVALARWITISRKTGEVREVAFGEEESVPQAPAGQRAPAPAATTGGGPA